MSENYLDKIKKLLRLSQSANRHEAELALAKAQEIATLHNIDIALAKDEETEAFTKQDVDEKSYRRSYKTRKIDVILQAYFHVRISWNGRRTTFVGKKSDIEFAQWLRSYLSTTFTRLASQAAKEIHLFDRSSFYRGLTDSISVRLKKAKQEAEDAAFQARASSTESAEEISKRYAIVLVSDSAALAAFQKSLFPDLKTSKFGRRSFDEDSYLTGVEAGESVNLNRPLTGRTTQSLNA